MSSKSSRTWFTRNVQLGPRPTAAHALSITLLTLLSCATVVPNVRAQQASDVATSARAVAPVDLTGVWVSVIHEDWAWRMRTPPPGDYASLPLTDAAIAVADQWTMDQDGSCLAFGAAASLRQPTRARISWADDNTLQIDTDNGMQTRWLHFDAQQLDADAHMLQGNTSARWLTTSSVTGSGATGGILTTALERAPWASLEAVTTNLQPAWLRPNGVPYSENAVLTEYFDFFRDGDTDWFTVTIMVEDPIYLTEPLVISSNFKREPDDARWNPKPCHP